MSNEQGLAPMEEDASPMYGYSPSNDEETESDDFVLVMDWAPTSLRDVPQDQHPVKKIAPPSSHVQSDEFSFGSSGDDEDNKDKNEKDPRRSFAHVSLSTTFDMNVLQACIEESADALDLVTGKDVVVVVGKTGVGKSLFIQGIAGKRIKASIHKTTFSGQSASKTVFEAENALPNFDIGHATSSKTRSINAFLRKEGDNETVYLDSPGLEDTRGVEMDIATSALLSQVARRCRSLRFVVLTHCASLLEDRGGAFRSVMRFAKTFVQDFDESKRSFMFLFTHTDEIAGMSSSVDDARRLLQEEIVRTADGTKEEDVALVLDFVRKSLKKKYPFADILHPIETDYHKLAQDIDMKLCKVTNLTLAMSCNLALSSKLRLEGAVRNLLQSLRNCLAHSSPNIAEVKRIQRTFHYLKEYVKVDCVRSAVFETEEVIDGQIKTMKKCISIEFSRGTSQDTDFEKENVQALSNTIDILQELDANFSSKQQIQTMKQGVIKLQGEIIRKAHCLEPFHRDLHKMKIWAEGFEEFSDMHAVSCNELSEYIGTVSGIVSIGDTELHYQESPDDFSIYAENLLALHVLCEHSFRFPTPEINTKNATSIRELALCRLRDGITLWSKKTDEFSDESTPIDYKNDLKDIAAHIETLEIIQQVIKKKGISITPIEKDVLQALKKVEDDVTGRYEVCCNELKDAASSFDPSWEPKLSWMRSVCHIFSRLQGVQWKVMHSSFILLIDKIKSVLYTAMGELDNMSNMIREHGMRHGKTMGIEYAKLSNCSWFDSYLPAEDEFIANFCTKIIADAKTRIDEKTFDLAERLKTLCTKQSPNTDTIEKIGLLIPELSEIDNFVAVATESTGLVVSTLYTHNGSGQSTDEAATLTAWCVRNLEKYAASLSQLATKCIGYWIKNLSTGRIGLMRSLTRKINSILVNATTLEIAVSADGLIRDKAQSILAAIYDGCKQFAHQVKSELKTFDGNFVLKAAFLTSVCACSGFTPIRDHLPDYKIIQHEIRDVVASEAHRIESDMETSSDWDRIDQCILQFKSATVLDDFVSNEVSSRLSTLQRQRDQKEVQVDDLLRDMIHVNNFKGIHAFISPFANSKDQVKRQKFDTYMDEICFSLALAIKDVERYIQQDSITENEYQLISRSIDILAQAKDNLQWLMKPKLDLASIISSLKFGINQKLEAYISQIVQAMREKDFVQAARSKHNATMCCQKLELCIKESNKRKMKSANSEYKQEIGNILKQLEMFFESRFEDVSDLSRSMSTLKRATEAGEVQLDELVSLYEELKKTLSDKVRKIISRVNESVSEAKCFDDVIPYFHALSRQMNGPLKMHCSVDLLMECENLNERLHLEKKEHDRSFDFGEDRIEQTIEMLAQRLDKLESPSVYQKIWLWMKNDERKTYINLQEKLNKKVEDISKRAQAALKSRDLRSVQECIEFLVFVDKKAQKHVKFVQTRLRGLCEKCIASFLELCDKAKRFLESKDTSQFEEMYADYHGFVLFIPCVLESRDSQRQFSLVNQMLYESLDHEVKALHAKANATVYDFSAFRAQVVRVRRVGNFFADRLTLLNEEIKRSAHASGDEWLGRIHAICSRHFGNGRDFSKIRHCVVLGVVPSATKADIRRAYFEKAKRNHPDKLRNASGDSGFMFRETKEAYDELLLMTHLSRPNQSRPFDEILTSIGEKLRTLSKKFMQEQCYDMVERLLFQLPNLNMLEDLVHPKLNSDAIKLSIHETIKGHVEKTRVDVNSSWSERNYKNLNDSISDLKQMENHFKSHPEIFPTSWNTGIMDAIETEIEALGQKARACLQSYKVAKTKEGKFKRYFIEMGFVLIELPPFKAFTKTVMANVLESCLDSDWGYSYIFEFGLTLQRGDESRTDEANRVAQMLLSEFDHFKEVMTMVWNQETSQKPVEDTVNNIRGEHRESPFRQTKLNIDQGQLLGSFFKYEHEYKTLLGEYIKPNADLNVLVRKTLALAENLKPLQCDVGWEDDVKQSIPIILAGVFALFTILKSGSSFNRIEAAGGSSDFGEKLLMKPHHIQVMAVLKMLGCGSGSTALESQLMQIRTGKSC